MTAFIEPGAGVGIIGGGPLGYALAQTAKNLGMHAIVLAPSEDDIALTAADMPLVGAADDADALARLASVSTIVTYANENVDGDALAELTTKTQLPSGTDILTVTQDRYLEMVFLDDQNINILPYAQVVGPNDISKAIESVGFPAILKPIQKDMGADQQLLLNGPEDVANAQQLLQQRPYVLEAWLAHPVEFAVAAAKSGDTVQVMPPVQTVVDGRSLQAAFVPTTAGPEVTQELVRVTKVIAEHLDYTGAFGVEFFMTESQSLYVKRIYPAPQVNTAVLATTAGISPVEMHLRALLGWPLPMVSLLRPGFLVPLATAQKAAAMTQVQIKPDWHFEFYPVGSPQLGAMTIFHPAAEAVAALNATDHFHLSLNKEE